MIRLILISIFLISFLLLSTPLLLIEKMIAKRHPNTADISQLRIVQWAFRVIIFLTGTRLTIIGEDHIPKDQAVLYIGNHRSYFDIVITYARCPQLTGYVAKDTMLKIPILSIWMKRLYCLFLNRDDVKEGLKMILTGIDQIKNGISMCIFPEGSRSWETEETEMQPFKEGSLKMAEKTGCPIIPMAISGTADIWEKHFPWIHPADVTVEYGSPIDPKELAKEDRRHLGKYTQNIIREMLIEHQK